MVEMTTKAHLTLSDLTWLDLTWLDFQPCLCGGSRARSVSIPFFPTAFSFSKTVISADSLLDPSTEQGSGLQLYTVCMHVWVAVRLRVSHISIHFLFLLIGDIKHQMSDVYLKHQHTLGLKTLCALQCIWSCVTVTLWYLMFEVWCFFELGTIFPRSYLTWLLKVDMKCVRGRNRDRERVRSEAWFSRDVASLKSPWHKSSIVWYLHSLTREFTAFYFLLYACDCWRFGYLIAAWQGVSHLCSFVSVSADMWH